MSYTLADLELARRHVSEGAARIRRQREIIGEMSDRAQPTEQAETLLDLLEQTQSEFENHLQQIEADLSAG